MFVGCLGSLFIVCSDPWRSIVEVSWEDDLRTVDHEEGCVAGGSARSCPQALEYGRKLSEPARAEFVQPVENSRLKALQEHAICALDLPVPPGVHDGCPIDPDVLFIVESNEFLAGELRAIVCDDGVRYSKAMDDVEEE